MSKTLETQSFGTSGHKNNPKPRCDDFLSKIHVIIGLMKRLGTLMKFYDDVKDEHERKKVQTLDFAVHTRWNSAHSETMCGT